jgi:hypothetical protein
VDFGFGVGIDAVLVGLRRLHRPIVSFELGSGRRELLGWIHDWFFCHKEAQNAQKDLFSFFELFVLFVAIKIY